MKFSKINFFCACALVLILPVQNAPRSRSKNRSTIHYNQQQSGDYNIQVHLKDVHVIALLGDDSLGGFGDYDYNYDYSDLTVKPVFPVTTTSPEGSNNSSASEGSDAEVILPEVQPDKPSKPLTTHEPFEKLNATTLQPQLSTNSESSSVSPAVIINSSISIINPVKPVTLSENPKKPTIVQKVVPQKITKAENSEEIIEKKTDTSVTNISIVPAENPSSVSKEQHIPLGEIMHYRKCSEGYARDKQGRCRKNRWTHQLPFGLSRFASNLASRFRQATTGTTIS